MERQMERQTAKRKDRQRDRETERQTDKDETIGPSAEQRSKNIYFLQNIIHVGQTSKYLEK